MSDAYRNQTDALKAYSKEAAQTFLNENHKGLEDATKQITQERHCILSNGSISAYTNDGKALKEIAEQFEERGISIRSDSEGDALFSIHLTADAENAYDTINAFCTAVKEKSKDSGDSGYFNDVSLYSHSLMTLRNLWKPEAILKSKIPFKGSAK